MTTVGHYIDGSRIDPSSQLLVRHNPATAEVIGQVLIADELLVKHCLLYTSPSPRDLSTSRMPSSA